MAAPADSDALVALRRLTAAYSTLAEVQYKAMMATEQAAFLQEAATILAERNGFPAAWVGLVDPASQFITVCGAAGPQASAIKEAYTSIMVSADPASPYGQGPVGQAVRGASTIVWNELPSDTPWSAFWSRCGLESAAVFPMRRKDGVVVGVVVCYAAQKQYFDHDVVELGERIAACLVFGLDLLEQEAARGQMEGLLRRQEQNYRVLFEHNPLPMWVHAAAGQHHILAVNEAALAHYGYTRQEFMGLSVQALFAGEPPPVLAEMERRLHGDQGVVCQGGLMHHRRKDGAVVDVEVWVSYLDFDGQEAWLVMARDVTEQRQLMQRYELALRCFEYTKDALMITDEKTIILQVNQAFSRITGFSAQQAVGNSPSILYSGLHPRSFYEKLWRDLETHGRFEGEIWDRRRSGEVYPAWLAISAVHDEQRRVTHYVAAFSDLTSEQAQAARIEYLATHDVLTGLPNRDALKKRLAAALQQARHDGSRLALLVLAPDRFRHINESLGHAAGDKILQQMAGRLGEALAGRGVLFSLGGTRFAVLLQEHGDAVPDQTVAAQLQERLSEPFPMGDEAVLLQASVGMACYPGEAADADTLIVHAELALGEAKKKGGNRVQLFQAEMSESVWHRFTMERDLRHALDNDELFLVYQPQVNLQSGKLVAVEALVRWQHPKRGLISPGEFIPLAEEVGLIKPLGSWVLRQACQSAKSWLTAGYRAIPVAVNVSAIQFADENLVVEVASLLQEVGLEPQFLELEVTEGVLVQDMERSVTMLKKLKELGVTIAIDDFGTGYSSLSYLARFPLDRLKLDRSFVQDMHRNHTNAEVARAVITLAHALGLEVVAEGVETLEEYDALRQLACEYVQGYYVSRPVGKEYLEESFLRSFPVGG